MGMFFFRKKKKNFTSQKKESQSYMYIYIKVFGIATKAYKLSESLFYMNSKEKALL